MSEYLQAAFALRERAKASTTPHDFNEYNRLADAASFAAGMEAARERITRKERIAADDAVNVAFGRYSYAENH